MYITLLNKFTSEYFSHFSSIETETFCSFVLKFYDILAKEESFNFCDEGLLIHVASCAQIFDQNRLICIYACKNRFCFVKGDCKQGMFMVRILMIEVISHYNGGRTMYIEEWKVYNWKIEIIMLEILELVFIKS